ncbi:MAG TPA: efflux RND transporter periplasmic adaptor subunit [Gemmatimonas sp.]|uniref:efflux RND transporter periplasmic adaptor subunit n=1 Tax=Gemmatimonas sp. TaxID=1962908 RepID=UPI002ED8981E
MTVALSARSVVSRQNSLTLAALSIVSAVLVACSGEDAVPRSPGSGRAAVAGTPIVVAETTLSIVFDASGVAEPVQQATLSTRLMGTVVSVHVHEGQMVRAGQPLVDIDARDLVAKATQAAASVAGAEAAQHEAAAHAARFTALYHDSAATRAQYESALTALARAEAGLRASRAGAAELEVVRSYASVRAPFDGMVTQRMADVGALAAPGAPLITVQDVSSLRLTASVPADVARTLRPGRLLAAQVDGDSSTATVEGIIPAGAGGLFTVNALIRNRDARRRAGSTATLHVPMGTRPVIAVPHRALVRDGDLVGVVVRHDGQDDRRWVRLGAQTSTHAEVLSGLRAGETIVVPSETPVSTPSVTPGAL